MKKGIILLSLLTCNLVAAAQQAASFLLRSHQPILICVDREEEEVVQTASSIFMSDCKQVLQSKTSLASAQKAKIVVGTLTSPHWQEWAKAHHICIDSLLNRHEGFLMQVYNQKGEMKLALLGSDKRGTAFGLMTLSRLMGVSPWEWWADCTPTPITEFKLPADYKQLEYPSVAYRGIFLNDEDWGLTPWSSENYEPKMRAARQQDASIRKGEIGPYTHERIFELLLRLRANTFWPAMHECSKPFYLVKGNLEVARRYGILVSTSHCEPMMRNTNGEWKVSGVGEYDFLHNATNVTNFWEERVKELKGVDCLYTLGMRGVHDSAMQGAKTVAEQTEVLSQVLKVQRDLLKKHINSDVTDIPQQFIPYKEVLDCYHAGLKVPDDVSLIWCDDNYGYIRHFPTPQERARKGGNGIYYHISYWGRPHDYLWLSTTHPQLIQAEMTRAYNKGISNIWILNVGDIKPGEYTTSLFLDMAWNIRKVNQDGLERHLTDWYTEQVGIDGKQLLPLWDTYYNLSFNCRPEFLGGTRTEEKDPAFKQIADIPFNEKEIHTRLQRCDEMVKRLNELQTKVPSHRQAAWFQLVAYPIQAMAAMNKKMLGAQLARHQLGEWQSAHQAYEQILSLTQQYNTMLGEKWNKMMDCHPRTLPVFEPVKEVTFETPMPQGQQGIPLFVSKNAIGEALDKGKTKCFTLEPMRQDSITLEVQTLPVHPSIGNTLRYSLQLENQPTVEVDFHTEGRSEEWKCNVLRNAAVRRITLPCERDKAQTLTLKALDEGVILQTIRIQ